MYLDSRLILDKLETQFPSGAVGAGTGEHAALERLLQRWTVDAGVFGRAAQLIPTSLPGMRDERFRKDREGFGMRGFGVEEMERMRPEAVVMVRSCFELLETTVLADGRAWVFGGEGPGLGDIEGEFWVLVIFVLGCCAIVVGVGACADG